MPARISGWICTLLLACCSGRIDAIEPDPCIPPDTIFAMKIRPRQILTSALVKEMGWDESLITMLAANDPVREFLDTAGLRMDRDLDSVLWCQSCSPFLAHFYRTTWCENLDTGEKTFFHSLTGQPLAPGEKDATVTGLIVLEGRFKPKSLLRAIEKHGKEAGAPVRKSTDQGNNLLQLDTPKGPLFVAFQGNNKIFVSNQKTVIRNCLAGGFDKPVSPKLADSLSRLSDTDSLWAVHVADNGFLQSFPYEGFLDDHEQSLLESVKEDLLVGQISIRVSDGLQTSMGFSTKSAQAKTVLEQLAKNYVERISKGIDQAFATEKIFRKSNPVSWGQVWMKLRVSLVFLAGKQGKICLDEGYAGIGASARRKKLDLLLTFIHPEED